MDNWGFSTVCFNETPINNRRGYKYEDPPLNIYSGSALNIVMNLNKQTRLRDPIINDFGMKYTLKLEGYIAEPYLDIISTDEELLSVYGE